MTGRVGIFGGSFDPVHNAHLALARCAQTQLALDEVLWVPAGQPWQKHRGMTDAVHREAMVRLAIEGEPGFTLSRIELERAGPSYTIDTVRALHAARPGVHWVLVIGEDQYAGFDTWNDWRELLDLVTLAVAGRSIAHGSPADPAGTRVSPEAGPASDGSAPNRDSHPPSIPYETISLPAMAVSSTGIRERIAGGLPIDDLVPPRVARYIESHGLYRGPTAA